MQKRFAFIVLLASFGSGCVTIDAGQAGVVWHARGGTDEHVLGEGLHYVRPYDQVESYDLRSRQQNERLEVLAVNGLAIVLDTSIRYHIVPTEVRALHTELGPSYYGVIIGPVLRSQARRVVGRYTPEEIYSTKRELIEREMREAVEKATLGKHVVLEAILVRNVQLPPTIQQAIMDKLSEEQSALKMTYVLDGARKEAERKQIEARGIAAFQDIVSAKLSEAFLRWKQVEALERLALSPNAKTVMLSGRDSPILLEPTR
jgi:regulator of protease activity HflC (stomatin/prohibitin superfamily)